MKHSRLIEISTELTLRNMETLLHIFAGRIVISNPDATKRMLDTLSEDDPVCMNHACIQLNIKQYPNNPK